MTNELATRSNQTAIQRAGLDANDIARRNTFATYQADIADNTKYRQRKDLELFARYLDYVTAPPTGDLYTTPEAWRGMTWGLIEGFMYWQIQQGYAVSSVGVRLSTVKKYAALAFKAGVIDTTEDAMIARVHGKTYKQGINVDKDRSAAGIATRRPGRGKGGAGAKKADSVSIPLKTVKALRTGSLDTAQGRRDALLMCLLLDHGLRCGEVALLTVKDFNLADGTMTFYRPKVAKIQTHKLSPSTHRALKAWIDSGDCPLASDAPILRGSTKGGALNQITTVKKGEALVYVGGMTERAITKRVAYLGAKHDLKALSAHDCRHYWATDFANKSKDVFRLQEAGGWNSLAMPRRYVEEAAIANEGWQWEED